MGEMSSRAPTRNTAPTARPADLAPVPRRRPPRCLPVGKGNARVHVGRGKFCPTDTQRAWLQPAYLLGCGSYACAFERPDGKVAKITQDPADIANLLLGQDHPRVVRVYDAKELRRGSRARKPYYGAIVEKVEKNRALSQMTNILPTHMLDDNFERMDRRGEGYDYYHVEDKVRDAFHHRCQQLEERQGDNPAHGAELGKACRTLADGLLDLHEFYGMHGVNLTDLHGGNVGATKDGEWRVLDVGYAKTDKPEVPILAGPPRRRR